MKKVLKITAVTTLLSLGLAFSSYAGNRELEQMPVNGGMTRTMAPTQQMDGAGSMETGTELRRITALTRVAGCMCLRRHQIRRRWMPMVHEHRMEKLLR